MKTKRSYTQMSWPASAMWLIKHDPKAVNRALDIYAKNLLSEHSQTSQEATDVLSLGMTYSCTVENKGLNIFLRDGGFAKWLADCAPVFDSEFAKELYPVLERQGHILIVHFPCESKICSFAAMISKCCKRLLILSSRGNGPGCGVGCVFSLGPEERVEGFTDEEVIQDMKPGAECSLENFRQLERMARTVMGLVMYMDCFPEMVHQGLPEDLKHPTHHEYESAINLEVHLKACQGGTHNSPTPHYRVAHFRVLRSEKFTHKRFQTILIPGAFVKGRAVTVDEPVLA
jgi:hypothetical protein